MPPTCGSAYRTVGVPWHFSISLEIYNRLYLTIFSHRIRLFSGLSFKTNALCEILVSVEIESIFVKFSLWKFPPLLLSSLLQKYRVDFFSFLFDFLTLSLSFSLSYSLVTDGRGLKVWNRRRRIKHSRSSWLSIHAHPTIPLRTKGRIFSRTR